MNRETIMTISGNLVQDPVIREFDSGAAVTNFRVASSARRYDTGAGDWIDGSSVYLSVSCWGALAVRAHESLSKGKAVIVNGSLRTVEYIGSDGLRKSTMELKAHDIGLSLSRQSAAYCPTSTEENSDESDKGEDDFFLTEKDKSSTGLMEYVEEIESSQESSAPKKKQAKSPLV